MVPTPGPDSNPGPGSRSRLQVQAPGMDVWVPHNKVYMIHRIPHVMGRLRNNKIFQHILTYYILQRLLVPVLNRPPNFLSVNVNLFN